MLDFADYKLSKCLCANKTNDVVRFSETEAPLFKPVFADFSLQTFLIF